jgi:hypothetical protein
MAQIWQTIGGVEFKTWIANEIRRCWQAVSVHIYNVSGGQDYNRYIQQRFTSALSRPQS